MPSGRHGIHLSYRVLFRQEDDLWLAHILECDVVAQGRTRDEAKKGIVDALTALIADALANGDLAPLFGPPAPPDVWEQFMRSERRRKAARVKLAEHSADAKRVSLELEGATA
jgi:predicted RNase H-like HicB family nuclease